MDLKELLATNHVAIIDTCVWRGPQLSEQNSLSRRRRPGFYRAQAAFIEYASQVVREVPTAYITQGVFQEMTRKNLPYKKLLRTHWLQRDAVSRENIQQRVRANKKCRQLIQELYRQNKCLNYTHHDFINYSPSLVYEALMESLQPLCLEHLLSETDQEILVSAATLAHEGVRTAMVSNDFGIMRAWRDVYSESIPNVPSARLRFYIMPGFNQFRELYCLAQATLGMSTKAPIEEQPILYDQRVVPGLVVSRS